MSFGTTTAILPSNYDGTKLAGIFLSEEEHDINKVASELLTDLASGDVSKQRLMDEIFKKELARLTEITSTEIPAGISTAAASLTAELGADTSNDKFRQLLIEIAADQSIRGADDAKLILLRANLTKTLEELSTSAPEQMSAYTSFREQVRSRMTELRVRDDALNFGRNTSYLLAQVAVINGSPEVMTFAKSLGAVTDGMDGLSRINKAAGLFKLPTEIGGGFTLGNLGTLAGGLGMALAAASVLSNLLGDDEAADNGIGQAFAALHQSIFNMHNEMRQSFAAIYKLMQEHEIKNQKRFEIMIKIIEHYGSRNLLLLDQHQAAVHSRLHHMHSVSTSFLEAVVDESVMDTVRTIDRSTDKQINENIQLYSSVLSRWLISTSSIKGRTGYLDLHKSDYAPSIMVDLLYNAHKEGVIKKLGLLGSIANSYAPGLVDASKLINPFGWPQTLQKYIQIVNIGMPTIFASPSSKAIYARDIAEMRAAVSATKQFLERSHGSRILFNRLTDNYIQALSQLKALLAIRLEMQRHEMNERHEIDPTRVLLRLDQSATENLARLSDDSTSLKPINIEGMLIKFDTGYMGKCLRIGDFARPTTKEDMLTNTNNYLGRTGQQQLPDFKLSAEQANVVSNYGSSHCHFIALINTALFRLAKEFGLADAEGRYYAECVSNDNVWWDFTSHIVFGVRSDDAMFPQGEVNLWLNEATGRGFKSPEQYYVIAGAGSHSHGDRSTHFFSWTKTSLDEELAALNLTKLLDEKVLTTHRKIWASKMLDTSSPDVELRALLDELCVAELELKTFLQLHNAPKDSINFVTRIEFIRALQVIRRTGELDKLKELFDRLDMGHHIPVGPMVGPISLQERLRQNIWKTVQNVSLNTELWQMLTLADRELETLNDALERGAPPRSAEASTTSSTATAEIAALKAQVSHLTLLMEQMSKNLALLTANVSGGVATAATGHGAGAATPIASSIASAYVSAAPAPV